MLKCSCISICIFVDFWELYTGMIQRVICWSTIEFVLVKSLSLAGSTYQKAVYVQNTNTPCYNMRWQCMNWISCTSCKLWRFYSEQICAFLVIDTFTMQEVIDGILCISQSQWDIVELWVNTFLPCMHYQYSIFICSCLFGHGCNPYIAIHHMSAFLFQY